MSTADNEQGMNGRLKAESSHVSSGPFYLPMTEQRTMTQQLLGQFYPLLFAHVFACVWAVWLNILLPWVLSQALRIINFWSPRFVGVEEAFFMFLYILSALYILPELLFSVPILPKIFEWIHDYSLRLSTQLHFHNLDVQVNLYARCKKYHNTTIPAKLRSGDNGLVLTSPNTKGTHLRKNIFVLSRAGSGASTLTGGDHHGETESAYNDMPEVILDSQAHVNCTGHFNVLSNLDIGPQRVVLIAANGEEMPTIMSGSVRLGNLELNDVHYCPDLGNRIIVSGSVLDNLDYQYEYGRGKFSVKDLRTGRIVGEGRLVNGNYIVDYLKIPHDRTRMPDQRAPSAGLVTSVWNVVSSTFHRLRRLMNLQGPPM